jgi:hypothetical protein
MRDESDCEVLKFQRHGFGAEIIAPGTHSFLLDAALSNLQKVEGEQE